MQISETGLLGVSVVRSTRGKDERGGFARWFCAGELEQALGGRRIVQINHSQGDDTCSGKG